MTSPNVSRILAAALVLGAVAVAVWLVRAPDDAGSGAAGARGTSRPAEPAPVPLPVPEVPETAPPIAVVPLPAPAPVVLEPLLASGIVRFGGGPPVAGARVRLRHRAGPRVSAPVVATCDGSGAFEFRGPAAPGSRVELRPLVDGCFCPAVETAAGSRDLVLEVRRHGGIAGSLVATDPALLPELGLRVESLELEEDGAPRWRYLEPDREGRFRAAELAPGRWRVDLQVGSDRMETLAEVEVQEGLIAEPPELQSREVGAGWFAPRVTVLDSRGARLSRATVEFRPRGHAAARTANTGPEGRAVTWFTAPQILDLRVRHDAGATAVVENPAWPAEVVLQARGSLEIRFSGGLPRVDGVEAYELVLDPRDVRDTAASLPQMRPRPLPPGTTDATFQSLDPGSHALRLRPTLKSKSGRRLVGRTLELGTIEIRSGNQEQSLAVDAETVRRAITP